MANGNDTTIIPGGSWVKRAVNGNGKYIPWAIVGLFVAITTWNDFQNRKYIKEPKAEIMEVVSVDSKLLKEKFEELKFDVNYRLIAVGQKIDRLCDKIDSEFKDNAEDHSRIKQDISAIKALIKLQ